MKKYILSTSLLLTAYCQLAHAQFAPQVSMPGTTAIHKDSSIILSWAPNCSVNRGWKDIVDQFLGYVSSGDESKGTAKADGEIVSLGDGGEAIYFFENPIVNGSGYDFAIFENGFPDPTDSSKAYLELAQVEVSNNGIQYFPFPSTCYNDTSLQIAGVGDYMDASKINNLAGKYIQNYGTPFDLDELSMILSLDVNNIRFIKVKDVIGTLNNNVCTRDMNQHKINDPYPTPYATGGFDLDALAILHQKYPVGIFTTPYKTSVHIYPNPSSGIYYFDSNESIVDICVHSWQGKILDTYSALNGSIDLSMYTAGNYLLGIKFGSGETKYIMISKL
ncbi:MAG: T9SS type A sorting domain-containing protein [Bacteroidetes bacterium]|nr:T9SS type A sorting domain-containing protein [Bacteroidota bacterium]